MAADLQLSNDGIKYAGGNIVDLRATMPSSGSWVAGDVILESTPQGRVSGWKRATTGTGNVLGTDWIYFSGLQSAAPVATTTGTAVDLTGIPPGVRRITLSLNGVSTSGTAYPIVQIGSGSVDTAGYLSSVNYNTGVMSATTGFVVGGASASDTRYGALVLTHLGGNVWVHTTNTNVQTNAFSGGGGKTALSGSLDRIRFTTVGYSDTFDGGSFAPMWE